MKLFEELNRIEASIEDLNDIKVGCSGCQYIPSRGCENSCVGRSGGDNMIRYQMHLNKELNNILKEIETYEIN